MKNRVILLIIILVISVVSKITAQNVSAQFEQDLRVKNRNVESICCSFKSTHSMMALANNVIKSGKFYYLQPDNILLSFDDGDYIKMYSGLFEINNGGRVNKMKISANPMLRSLNTMLSACMSGDMSKITSGFSVDIKSEDKTYVMTLTSSRGKTSRTAEIKLVFDRDDMSLSLLKMTESSGDYTQYEFFDKTFNANIDVKLFETN